MPEPDNMWVPVVMLSTNVMEKYQLHDKFRNGRLIVRIDRGMYGLSQYGILAYKQLVENLKPHGYIPIKRAPGYWKHKALPISFCLTVDDFGVNYVRKNTCNIW